MQVPVIPIDVGEVVAVVMGSLIILIPIAGLTARFALKPVAEAMAKMRESQSSGQRIDLIEQRLDLMEQQLGNIESAVHRLREAQDFHAELQKPKE